MQSHQQIIILNKTAFQNNLKNSLYLQFTNECKQLIENIGNFNSEEHKENLKAIIREKTTNSNTFSDSFCQHKNCAFIEFLSIFHKNISFFHLHKHKQNNYCYICLLRDKDQLKYTDIVISNDKTVRVNNIII